MKEDVKTRWLESLRGGLYEQGQYHLRYKTDRYCCLGVLCDVVDPEGWGTHAFSDSIYAFDGSGVFLPAGVRIGVDITDQQQMELASMNDRGCTFAEIADHIEANL